MFRTTTIIALAGLVSAQLQISQSCTHALTGIVANQDANTCLSPISLISLVTDKPITNWTRNVCSAAPCSNQTLATIVSSLANGCQAEISGAADSSVNSSALASTVTPLVQQYYPTVRRIICLQDNGNNCLASTLNDIQSATDPLTINHIIQLITLGNVPDIPSNVTCSDCTKAAYNILRNDAPTVVADASGDLQQQCGANFTDGNNPAGITDSAVGASGSSGSSNQGNGAMVLVSPGLGVSALTTIVSAVFALFN